MPNSGQPQPRPTSVTPEVLEQRLYTQEAGLRNLAEDTGRQIRDLASNTSNQINSLATQISKLDSSLQERGKIQWPAMSVALGALLAIGALVYWPIRENQQRIETVIAAAQDRNTRLIEKLADSVPTSREIDTSSKRRDDWQRYAEERFKKMEDSDDSQRKQVVPRGEHEEKWRGAESRFSDVQRQIDGLKADFGGLYSPRDALTSMQRRLEDLERRLSARNPQG